MALAKSAELDGRGVLLAVNLRKCGSWELLDLITNKEFRVKSLEMRGYRRKQQMLP